MAWRSSGGTNAALVNNLAQNGLIESERVKQAMLQVDRAHFAPSMPYEDSPQPIGHKATISAPHMHASACESLLPYLHPGAKVLDIGSGSGYLTAVLANLVGPTGTVIGVDHIQPLVDLSLTNMRKSEEGKKMLDSGQVKFIKADGRKGWKEGAPYDAIHVGAAAAEHHQELTEQLKAPGRLFVPVAEGYMQNIWVVDKKEDGSVERKKMYGVQYVPLTDAPSVAWADRESSKRRDAKREDYIWRRAVERPHRILSKIVDKTLDIADTMDERIRLHHDKRKIRAMKEAQLERQRMQIKEALERQRIQWLSQHHIHRYG